MLYSRLVEVGRICLINYGLDYGKVCTIVDVINLNRALVDGVDIPRQSIPFKRLLLTDIVMKVGRGASSGKVKKAWMEQKVQDKYDESSLGKKRANFNKKAAMSDLDRFKLMLVKKNKSKLLRKKLAGKS
eukprot:GHVR01173066.1.p1 GENE.GHVR01173066.1~~GHVR01173066.1.p1  ORF type:complete len:130 (+),score=18.10 GHVR01173066.1:34-423(+)